MVNIPAAPHPVSLMQLMLVVAAAPIALMTGYMAWLMVPLVFQSVVVSVVEAVVAR